MGKSKSKLSRGGCGREGDRKGGAKNKEHAKARVSREEPDLPAEEERAHKNAQDAERMRKMRERRKQRALEERAASQEERRELVAIVMEEKEDPIKHESIQRRVRREAQKLRAMLAHTAEKYPNEAADVVKALHKDQRVVDALEAGGFTEAGGLDSMVVDNIKIEGDDE